MSPPIKDDSLEVWLHLKPVLISLEQPPATETCLWKHPNTQTDT
uniref:Uncharacterized protein n=1 Tax=Heterorhabditis bacteriophora TaxID=37862 RepID=A0A1I7XP35_HETBA